MRITFLVGNGFDIQSGLKTSYSDFYDTVFKKNIVNDNQLYISIKDNPKSWADFESQLGEYTKVELPMLVDKANENNRDEVIDTFFEDLKNVTEDLAEYLTGEEKRFMIEEASVSGVVKKTLDGFYSELRPDERKEFEQYFVEREQHHVYNFICFNYTHVLDNLLSSISDIKTHSQSNAYSSYLKKPIHIHGELDYHITLGVDNEVQLNEKIFDKIDLPDLIKPQAILESRDGRLSEADDVIKESNMIVIFGMSLGETDKTWWVKIGDWLKASSSHLLIIHNYVQGYNTRHGRDVRKNRIATENALLRHLSLEIEQEDILREQIFINNTNKLFFKFKKEEYLHLHNKTT